MKGYKVLSALAGLALFLSLLLTSIDLLCFNRSFFRWQYSLNHTAESIGISEDGLMNATNTLLDYMQDKRDDIKVVEEVKGSKREIFDERETLHMVDVKNLYLSAMKTRTILLVGSIAILTLLAFTHRNQSYTILSNAYQNGLLCLGSLIFFIAIYAMIDFNGFWMNFHYVFFDNDLFLLDPNISIMINMFPSNFFFAVVFGIILLFVSMVILLKLLLMLFKHKIERRLV